MPCFVYGRILTKSFTSNSKDFSNDTMLLNIKKKFNSARHTQTKPFLIFRSPYLPYHTSKILKVQFFPLRSQKFSSEGVRKVKISYVLNGK